MSNTFAGVVAVAVAVGAWFAEFALIHAAGYSGLAGAGWITAFMVPIGAGAWVWGKLSRSRAGSRAE